MWKKEWPSTDCIGCKLWKTFAPKNSVRFAAKGTAALKTGGQGVEIPGEKNREFYGKE